MPDNLTPQPWWAALVGGMLFTIRWLIGFGASSAKATIESQRQDLDRLNARVNKLEEREKEYLVLIDELRAQNAMLRKVLKRKHLSVDAQKKLERVERPHFYAFPCKEALRVNSLTQNQQTTASISTGPSFFFHHNHPTV